MSTFTYRREPGYSMTALQRVEALLEERAGFEPDLLDAMGETDYFKPAVERGADFLDRVRDLPEWRPRINVEILDIGSGLNCVLGQLYGTYYDGVEELGITGRCADLGFTVQTGSCTCCYLTPRQIRAWSSLTEAWRLELRR